MKRSEILLTDECDAALAEALGDKNRSEFVEQQLWKSKQLQSAASRLGIERPERPKRGRPKKDGQ